MGDLAERCLTNIAAREGEVRAFTETGFDPDRVTADLAALETRWPDRDDRPPLFGTPVGVKDIIRVADREIRCGSRLPPERFAGPEAAVVTRLKAAGAVVMGMTVTTEFAAWAPGPTRNPLNLAHTPGGSSSGSAAGTGAGFFALALGSQTAGSVIRPAAFCGVIGVKASFGRIDREGMLPYADSLDHLGLFADSLDRAEAALSVICDGWTGPPSAAPRPMTIGVPDDGFLSLVDDAGQAVFSDTLDRVAFAGHHIVAAPLFTNHRAIAAAVSGISSYEMLPLHRPLVAEHRDLYRAETLAEFDAGMAMGEGDYQPLRAFQRHVRDEVAALTDDLGVDLWLTPSARGRAPEGIGVTGDPAMNAPWTFVGWPVVTLPCASDGDGLAYGMSAVARPGQDERLLAACRALEPAIRP
ncbi:MAG: amidase [Rhodospirillales bacterium]|nr:amidase [Rhodospirillales bacterium]